MKKLAFVFYIVFILIVLIIPLNTTGLSEANNIYILTFRLDYLIHTLMFLPWVFVCEISFGQSLRYPKLVILLSGIFLAAALEYSHYFLPYRAFNVNDLIYNVVGVLLGSLIWIFYNSKRKKNT